MSARKVFYAIAILGLAVLFVNAIRTNSQYNGRRSAKRFDHFETLTYQECAERSKVVREELTRQVQTSAEYFKILTHAYALMGSIRKAMHGSPSNWTEAEQHPDLQTYDTAYRMLEDGPGLIDDFSKINLEFMRQRFNAETEAERDKFNESGFDPNRQPEAEARSSREFIM